MQITSGVRSILSVPIIYSLFQYIMGAHSFWKSFVLKILQPEKDDFILDVGCGPADVLSYLNEDIRYWGFDISEEYINKAKKKYGNKGNFSCKLIQESDISNLPLFDKVIFTGLLHHLEDKDAENLIELAYNALKRGGKLITVDPCYTQKQNPIARFLISKDRGQNVRDSNGYAELVNKKFDKFNLSIVHKSWIPYTHCYMVCIK